MQGADDMAMDEPVQETSAAGGSQDAAIAAAAEELPCSSNGVSPRLQQATEMVQKRVALPEHAEMVTELQVCSKTSVLTLSPIIRCCNINAKRWLPKGKGDCRGSKSVDLLRNLYHAHRWQPDPCQQVRIAMHACIVLTLSTL